MRNLKCNGWADRVVRNKTCYSRRPPICRPSSTDITNI